MKNFTTLTLGELLTSEDEIIKRNSISILKRLQNGKYEKIHPNAPWSIIRKCKDCGENVPVGQVCQLYCKKCISKHK